MIKTSLKLALGLILFSLIFSCGNGNSQPVNKKLASDMDNDSLSKDSFRPNYHFTPKKNWMNDPNGLVYQNGKYHLFFQHYPDSTVWGPMHWGHAVSKDLISWEEKPIALYPDSLGYIFSGSAVVDKNNTAGFGKDAMITMFTYHDPKGEKAGKEDFQTQGIAYSLDEGETWTKYEGNPVIKNPGVRDFRDPKVFWNEEIGKWQMLLAAKDHIQFFESDNLKNWEKLSDFKFNDRLELGVWECPDLFELNVEGTNDKKWVLIISHGGESAPNGGSGTRYFVGDYDGVKFTTDQEKSQWIDYGTDNYAGVSYNNLPKDRRVVIGWMSNWNYATTTPTEGWRSAMTLPRKLTLVRRGDGYSLKSNVIEEISDFSESIELSPTKSDKGLHLNSEELSNCILSFEIVNPNGSEFSLNNSSGNKFTMGYEVDTFFTDRRKSGLVDFNEKFTNTEPQNVQIGKVDTLKVKLYIDKSSVEVFLNDGNYVMTNLVYPETPWIIFKIKLDGKSEIKNLKAEKINLNLRKNQESKHQLINNPD